VGMEHHHARRLITVAGGDPSVILGPVEAVYAHAAQEDRRLSAHGFDRPYGQHAELAAATADLYDRVKPHRHLSVCAVEYVVMLWFAEVDGRCVEVDPPADADVRVGLARAGRHADLLLMGPPYLSTFRGDLLAGLADGRIAIIDWKSCYKNDARKQRGFNLSGQMLQYMWWGRRAYGSDFGGVHVGMVDFSKLSSKDTSKVFPSYEVPLLAAALARFPQAVVDRAETKRRLLLSRRDPENYPRAYREQGPCEDRYGTCPFVRWCGEGVPTSMRALVGYSP